MNEEFLKLPIRCRGLIIELLDSKITYKERSNPSVDYDSMKHLFPLNELISGRYYGIGIKAKEIISLWVTGKPLPPTSHIKSKKIKIFGYEIRITITYKSIKTIKSCKK